MAVKDLGKIWECDVCGTTFSGINMPKEMRCASLSCNHSGFNYNQWLNICIYCLPNDYFRDPPIDKPLPKPTLKKLLDIFRPSCRRKP